MKAIIVALVFAFALTANCGLLKPVTEKAPLLALAQIDQHPLGKSLLSLMSLHMKAQGPLQDLPILLQQIHDDLDVQYSENEAQHESDVAYCIETTEQLKDSIEGHGRAYAINQEISIESTNALVRLHEHLEEVDAAIEANERRTAEGTAQREAQHALYESDLADNVDAIDACQQAIQLLNALRSGTSFVQLKSKFQKVAEKLEATKNAKHAHIYTPIIKALAQISSKADQEIIGRILDLLSNLLGQLQQARATIEQTEATQAALWAQELEDLTAEHARLVQDKADTEADIQNREDTLAAAEEQMASHLSAADNEATTLLLTQEECRVKEENYQHVKAELERETEIVQALQDHFNTKLAGLQEYIDNAPAAF